MIGKMKRALVPSAIVIYGALAFACGGDDDDDGGTTGGTTTGGGTMGGGGGDGGTCDSTTLKPYITKTVDATDTAMTIANIDVEVIDDESGMPLNPAYIVKSGANGAVTLMVDPCKPFGIKAHAGGGHTDTYSYHAKQERSNSPEALVRMGSDTASSLVPMLAVYDVKDDRAPAAGAVYWKRPNDEFYDVVGCAQIENESGVVPDDWELRYFADRLPSSKADWALTKGTRARDGRFFVGNAPPGKHTFVAKVNGTEIGRVDMMIFPRTSGSTMVGGHPANLFLAGIYIDEPDGTKQNPTPANCMQTQQ